MQKQLWQMLTSDLLMLYEIDQEDYERLSALMEQYQWGQPIKAYRLCRKGFKWSAIDASRR